MTDKKKILVVEDEAVSALDIMDIVKQIGHDPVEHVMRGEDAIQKARELSPDLVLMDIQLLGEMDGITAADTIWKQLQIPVVFLTAFADEATLARAKLSQPYGYVLKPFEEDELRASIELALYRFEQEVATDRKKVSRPERDAGSTIEEVMLGQKSLTPKEFLKRVDPFRQLPDVELLQLSEGAHFKEVSDGDYLVYQNDVNFPCFIVASGRIALVKGSSSGKELIVNLLPPGDIFGLVLALEEKPSSYSAQAQGDTSVLIVPREQLLAILEKHTELYKQINEVITERLEESHSLARRLAHDRVEVRIAAALIALVSEFSKVSGDSDDYVIRITRLQLADLTGTTPETAIRITKRFEREGLLNLTEVGVIRVADYEKLATLVEE